MRVALLVSLIVIALTAFISCSKPAQTDKYLGGKTDIASEEPIDITALGASALPTQTAKPQTSALDQIKKVVSPGALPKCVDQLAGAQKVWQKMKEVNDHYGTKPYSFDLGSRAYINGNPMTDMGAINSPIPLLKTWDTTKVKDVADVDSWATHGTMVRVEGIRRGPEGNWYMVECITTGLNKTRGWVPEQLVSTTRAISRTGVSGVSSLNGCGGFGGGG
jgi:hypothetical protein